MVEIGGRPILWHIMKLYSHFGVREFVICLGYRGYQIKEYFANYVLHNSTVTVDVGRNQLDFHGSRTEPWRVTLVDTGADTMTAGANDGIGLSTDTTDNPEDISITGFDDIELAEVIEQIHTNPDSRRHIVSAWNVAEIPSMKLPPCHMMFQFGVANGRLSCSMYQRSCDLFLGLPFNIASYALLTMMIAQQTQLQPGELIISLGDAHIYANHLEQVETQLAREPRALPTVRLDPSVKSVFDFRYEHFVVEGYDPHPRISAPIAV